MRAVLFALLLACSTAEISEPSTAPVAAEPAAAPAPAEVPEAPAEPVAEPAEPAQTPPPEPAPPAPAAPLADGGACLAAADCASGICEGQGCDASAPGTCAPKQRACTRDRRAFCGCDGETFFSSSACPGRRYASMGACE